MNIQIFGTKKSFDTKKAERFFKERNIKVQMIDMKEKGMSKGEYRSVSQALGGLKNMIDPKCKDTQTIKLLEYLTEDAIEEKVLENQHIFALPIVRNGKKATIGYQPDIWKTWE